MCGRDKTYVLLLLSAAAPNQHPRYYFYAQDGPTQALFLVEMLVATESRQATMTLKSDASPPLVAQFMEVWKMCLAGFCR